MEEVERALAALSDQRVLTEQTQRRMTSAIRDLASFVWRAHGLPELAATTPGVVRDFVLSPTSDGPPSPATMHFRRSAVRLLFSALRCLRLAETDPSLDLALPPRSSLHQRPLTEDEVAVCRSVSDQLVGTRLPAAWALAEATAWTSELPHIRVSDLDLANMRVRIHGGSKTDPRWGRLTRWGAAQLNACCARLDRSDDADSPLVYRGTGSLESRQASCCAAIAEVLTRAGLRLEPDVRPGSVPAWAGAGAFADGRSIEEVALLLGVRSLDQAARLIGWDWWGVDDR